jgi:hypothetical protein
MKLARITAFCIALLMVFSMQGWSQSSPAEAFKNVIIHTADGNTFESGTIVWRNGVITDVGENISVPFDAYVRDGGDSLHVYPGFIDGLALWGSPDIENNSGTPDEPGNPNYERAGIQPERSPSDLLESDDKTLAEAPKHGFTTAALGLKGRMLAGQIDLFSISGEKTEDNLLKSGLAVLAQFENAGGAAYPSTTMGLMAQFRQTFNDAKALNEQQNYYASTASNYPAPKENPVLEALYPVMEQEQPFYFVVDTKENIERLFWLKDELGFDVVVVSGKEAHHKVDELNDRNIPVLASFDLPEEPEWRAAENDDENVTEEVRIFREKQLQAYKADIENISKLLDVGVKVGYASNGLELSDIQKNIKTLIDEGGLSETQVLQILTQSTADILGYGQKLGDLQQGSMANFTVFSKPFTDEKTEAKYSVTEGNITEFESSKE